MERWLSKLDYKIKQCEELEKLFKAGWHRSDTTPHSKINVLQAQNPTDIKKLYKRLIGDWEAKGMRCLNTRQAKTRAERYEESKKDPSFIYTRARKEVLRQMKKTQKMPKPSTIKKYNIREEEIKECMGPQGIIYKVTSPSGKIYVGQTVQPFKERIKCHKKVSSNCTLLKRAISKYGDEMVYEIIEEVPIESLDERETYWIKELNSLAPNGYNCSTGGNDKKQLSQVLKDKIKDGVNIQKIEKNGYLGDVVKSNNGFTPRVRQNNKQILLSNGAFKTNEEAIEVLKEYTRYPENFIKTDGSNKKREKRKGCIFKSGNRWKVMYKHKYLGTFGTREHAEEHLHVILNT